MRRMGKTKQWLDNLSEMLIKDKSVYITKESIDPNNIVREMENRNLKVTFSSRIVTTPPTPIYSFDKDIGEYISGYKPSETRHTGYTFILK